MFMEVREIIGDEDIVRAIIGVDGYELTERHDGQALRKVIAHPKYRDTGLSAPAVQDDAENLRLKLAHLSELEGTRFGIMLGSVQSINPDGSTQHDIFLAAKGVSSCALVGNLSVVSGNLTEEERRRAEEEAAAVAAALRKKRTIKLCMAAIKDPVVFQVMQLLKIEEPTPTELGHIVDLVKKATGGDMNSFAPKMQLSRFHGSINNPDVIGLSARHAVTNHQPPSRPMGIVEVRAFARGIGEM